MNILTNEWGGALAKATARLDCEREAHFGCPVLPCNIRR